LLEVEMKLKLTYIFRLKAFLLSWIILCY